MVDFIKAFEEGKEAAIKAENARREIDEVFDDLNAQLNRSTRGKIIITREQLHENDGPFGSFIYPPRLYQAILAVNRNIKNSSKRELARWEISRVGYPVKISWATIDRYCEDRISLEECLADLIKDPIVAEQLLILINLKNEQDEVEKKEF
jgi:hypothetical protein